MCIKVLAGFPDLNLSKMDQIDVELERDISKLWKVHKTVHKMARDRGYGVSEEEYLMTLGDFKDRYGRNITRDKLTFLFQKEGGEQLLVFFCEDTNIGVKPMRSFVQVMSEKGINNAILVVRKAITPAAQKTILGLPKLKFEIFYENELLVNVTEHQLVPKHELLSSSSKKELLERYRVRETQLPRIQSSDPVARYFGLKRGDVVKILRPSETAGRYVTYRLVM